MAKCRYCNKDAGFLRKQHRSCSNTYAEGKAKITHMIYNGFFGSDDMKKIKDEIIQIAKASYISPRELDKIYITIYNKIVKQFLYDGIITHEEELKLTEFKNIFNFDQEFLDQHGLFQKFIKAVILRDIAKGKMPNVDFDADLNLPVKFEEDEKLIRLFEDVELYEKNKKGVDTKSVWFSSNIEDELFLSSVFSNDSIKTKSMKYLNTGTLIITNKSTYFISSKGVIKINVKNLSSLVPYQDGVGFVPGGKDVSFRVFRNLDGWFAYNVMFNLNR